MQRQPRIRVLHVLGSFGRGGVETWLMHVWRNIDREKFQFDFLLHTETSSVYQPEAQALGARLLRCPRTDRWDIYARECARRLQESGPYDVVHSHVHHFSALPLTVARRQGVRRRIAHSHQGPVKATGLARRVYETVARVQLNHCMTQGLAISETSADALFGRNWHNNQRVSVLHYGFDFRPFENLPARQVQKRLLTLPTDRPVIGHIGRFVEQKNHKFLVKIFSALAQRGTNAHLLLIGAGPLEQDIRRELAAARLDAHCTFAGDQNDVAPWLRAMDLFLLPSLYEGLGIVAVEAQAAGTSLIVSDRVPHEAIVLPELVEQLPLAESAERWAQSAERLLSSAAEELQNAYERVKSGRFGISRCLRELEKCYGEANDSRAE